MENGGVSATALGAARLLAASGLPWFWLDGEAAAPGERRVSYLGVASEVRHAVRGEEGAFLDALRNDSARRRLPVARRTGNGSPPAGSGASADSYSESFGSGWIVALGYEFGVALLGVDPHPDDVAPALALRIDAILEVDHATGSAHVTGEEVAAAQLRRLLDAGQQSGAGPRTGSLPGEPLASPGPLPSDVLRADLPPSGPVWRGGDYARSVAQCREAIRRGDAYVLCLTDTAETTTASSPLALYERLRDGAMRGGVISTPGRALVSASPERFLGVRGSTVATHPIKGTRPRGDTAARDAELAAELAADPKERAENLMIVDLMRNDLSRVCVPGSVRVERFLAVESHPRVHQLVSTVTGELAEGADVYDALRSCFPGGSMTGAPKRSAVEILARLEAGPRGLYSGCFGWIDDSGDADLAMTIRGAELRGDAVRAGERGSPAGVRALVGAGGGITIDSDPGAELRERDLKAAAMLANL